VKRFLGYTLHRQIVRQATHDASSVTALDVMLAPFIEELTARQLRK